MQISNDSKIEDNNSVQLFNSATIKNGCTAPAAPILQRTCTQELSCHASLMKDEQKQVPKYLGK